MIPTQEKNICLWTPTGTRVSPEYTTSCGHTTDSKVLAHKYCAFCGTAIQVKGKGPSQEHYDKVFKKRTVVLCLPGDPNGLRYPQYSTHFTRKTTMQDAIVTAVEEAMEDDKDLIKNSQADDYDVVAVFEGYHLNLI